MWRTDSLEKTLIQGRIEGKRRRGWQRMRWTQWTWVWASSRSWWWTGKPGMLQFMGSQRVKHDWVTELNCWANMQKTSRYICFSWDHKNSQFSWESQCFHRLPFHPPKHSMYAFLNQSLSLRMYWSLEMKGGIARQIAIFLFLPFLSMQILKTVFLFSPKSVPYLRHVKLLN